MVGPESTALSSRNSFTGEVDERLFTFHLFGGIYLEEPLNHLRREGQVRVLRIKDCLNGTDDIEGLHQLREAGKSYFGTDFHMSPLLTISMAAFQRGRNAFNLDAEFDAFCTKEIAAWQEIGEQLSKHELIRLSDHFSSPFSHHLHCPSFSTDHVTQQETADTANLSIELLMQLDGFNHPRMLIFDQLACCEAKSEGLLRYPEKIL